MVILIVVCPNCPWTNLGFKPASRANEAKHRLKSWNRILPVKPAFFMAGLKIRFRRLEGFTGEPFSAVKINPWSLKEPPEANLSSIISKKELLEK